MSEDGRIPVIRVTAMPADTNPYGGVFGGWLMGQMGLACGSFVSRRIKGKALLVAADAIKFPGAAITAPLIIGALLGGCLFSPDFMPPWLRTISYFIPHTWAMTAYQDLLVRGQGLGAWSKKPARGKMGVSSFWRAISSGWCLNRS